MDLTLDRIKRLNNALPAYTRPTIHVAGTNGKGSTTAILSSIFVQCSITTGRFNSPHLMHEWDGISLNGAPIGEKFYRETRAAVEQADRLGGIGATSFELLTATALQVFEAAHVDIVVMEVGLGGRLDATNALPDECIVMSVITAIDFDHTAQLGPTLDAIAREKAGIGRAGKVCIVARQQTPAVAAVIREVLDLAGAEYVGAIECTKRDWDEVFDGPAPPPLAWQPLFTPPAPQPYQFTTLPLLASQSAFKGVLALPGDHQLANLSTALTLINSLQSHQSANKHRATILNRILPSSIAAGTRLVRWPARLHALHLTCPPLSPSVAPAARALNHSLNLNPALQLDLALLVDGAHNVGGCAALHAYLAAAGLPARRTFLLACAAQLGKDPGTTLAPLLRPGDAVAVLPFSPVAGMPWARPVGPRALAAAAHALVGADGTVWCADDPTREEWADAGRATVREHLSRALVWAAARSKLAVVCGSLYLAADLYRVLKDPEDN